MTRDEFLAKAALLLAAPFVPSLGKRVEIDLGTMTLTKELTTYAAAPTMITAAMLRRAWDESQYVLGPDGEKYNALPRFDE